ncbi:MAG: helix-turn-helix transcriptional regulator [Lachnospiraceae bacterium]|nr:helix-turn-helix transcriptional regulator [Lachnospiraceae bacterium]
MGDKSNLDPLGLKDLLELFEKDVTIADINASRILGNISASIVKKRVELHMTQKEFAAHMSVSQGMVSKWEGGDYNFSIKTLADIVEKLDMELTVNLDLHKRDLQVRRIKDTDISYVVSEQKKFISKASRVNGYKSKINVTERDSNCKFYSFEERLEM